MRKATLYVGAGHALIALFAAKFAALDPWRVAKRATGPRAAIAKLAVGGRGHGVVLAAHHGVPGTATRMDGGERSRRDHA